MPLERNVRKVLKKNADRHLNAGHYFHGYETDVLFALSDVIDDNHLVLGFDKEPEEGQVNGKKELNKRGNIHLIQSLPEIRDDNDRLGILVTSGFDWMFRKLFFGRGMGPNKKILEHVQDVILPEYYLLNIIGKNESLEAVRLGIDTLAGYAPLLHMIEYKKTHLLYQRLWEKK